MTPQTVADGTESELQTPLASWRYKPIDKDKQPSPVCFPLSLRLVFKRAD